MALFLGEQDVKALLTMDVALEAVEDAFRQRAAGGATNDPRHRVALPAGALNVMSAAAPAFGVMGLKTYGAVRGGRIRFYVQLFSTETGELLAMIEASEMGRIRTGAASGVATKYMAMQDAMSVGVIGAGYQALAQVEAVCRVRDVAQVRVFSRTAERRAKGADEMQATLGVDAKAVDSPEACVEGADVVVTITSASRPVLNGAWLSPGTHVNAAGANHWMRRELDDEAVTRAGVVAVDDLEQARVECADLLYPIERGLLTWTQVRDLSAVVAGTVPGRTGPDEITLFESQGIALEDVVTGLRVYQLARERGVGRDLPL